MRLGMRYNAEIVQSRFQLKSEMRGGRSPELSPVPSPPVHQSEREAPPGNQQGSWLSLLAAALIVWSLWIHSSVFPTRL